jgi:hypothetical protein
MHARRSLILAVIVGFLLTPASRAIDKNRVKKAVEKGVAFLKRQQNGNTGQWDYVRADSVGNRPGYPYGMTALAGLTLLICDVPANDPAVQKAVEFIRHGADSITDTYSLSLCIMFFDQLGEHRDEYLIKGMAERLIKGQTAGGGWSYNCPRGRMLSVEERELQGSDQTGGKPKEGGSKDTTPSVPMVKGVPQRPMPPPPQSMPDFMKKQLEEMKSHGLEPGGLGANGMAPPFIAKGNTGDNSNSQFAGLAMWIARRHHVNVDESLKKLASSYSLSQNLNGGWSYIRGRGLPSTPPMTCAGLIGLAVGHGLLSEKKKDKVLHDPQVLRGLNYLQLVIGGPLRGVDMIGVYYFLWSLERTAMIYDIKTIKGKDWWTWGARFLLVSQNPDGSWRGKWAAGDRNSLPDSQACPETCFALMFLRRANLAKDLARLLRGGDPGEHKLHGSAEETAPIARTPGTPRRTSTETKPPSAVPPLPHRTSQVPETSTDSSTAGQLATDLVNAASDRQRQLLEEYRDGRGSEYTDALAGAIHKLTGDTREKARDALANRLTRMTAGTLRDKLQDDDREVRSAAALACGMKQDQALVPDLIDAIKDSDSRVAQAARIALESLTGKKGLGPAPTATRSERAAAAKKWRDWWREHKNP